MIVVGDVIYKTILKNIDTSAQSRAPTRFDGRRPATVRMIWVGGGGGTTERICGGGGGGDGGGSDGGDGGIL